MDTRRNATNAGDRRYDLTRLHRLDVPLEHDPSDLEKARVVASSIDPIPVGILYRNESVPCYEDLRRSTQLRTPEFIQAGLEAELDKFTIWPEKESAHAA